MKAGLASDIVFVPLYWKRQRTLKEIVKAKIEVEDSNYDGESNKK
jgi:hypothetical protein